MPLLQSRTEPSAKPPKSDRGRRPLTLRQTECLVWVSRGKSSTDIGQILRISPRTVDYHVDQICKLLDVRTRMQAVAYAIQRGWLDYEVRSGRNGTPMIEPPSAAAMEKQG